MRLRKYAVVLLILFFTGNVLYATIPKRTGWWKFDNSTDITKAEDGYGLALALTGSHSFAGGPEDGNGAVLIGPGSYYKMTHQISPNGSGKYVNEYTLQYDFKIPQNGVWHCFFQTAPGNNNDGDLFINPSGNIGVAAVGYSGYSVLPNEWYRLIVSVKNGSQFTCFLDGNNILSGISQTIDGRFSLDSKLLIFADDNAEDANIYCSELAIWDRALNSAEAKELGGYNHQTEPVLMTRMPYLQSPGQTFMNICWHDTAQSGTKVVYGLIPENLNFTITGTSELVSNPYRWHTVKLTGLQANTRYFYKVGSGNQLSGTYSFKTLPDTSYKGKIRFVLLSDTHATDTTMAGAVLRAARAKIKSLYGPVIENQVNGIFHSGDIVVSGNSPDQYTTQYFGPLSALSVNIPTMVVAGNHEAESPYFYSYLKLDELSAYPQVAALNEKIWQLRVGNSLFIGLNTNIIGQYGVTEANWLDAKLKEAEQDPAIDFVFLFFHHPPFSELWKVVNTFDGGANYVRDVLFPVIKKYTKVQQINYGHTHGFERGTIQSSQPDADFRIICGGGGGGPLDPWAPGENQDFNDIHICYSQYFYQILEIDIANHSFQNSMYSLGSNNISGKSVLLDSWHRIKNQAGPAKPAIETVTGSDKYIQVNTSQFSGLDSLMTVHFQASDNQQYATVALDTLVHWKNIYGIDKNNQPVDLHRSINLNQINISSTLFSGSKPFYFRVRYRDQNLKWSSWSDSFVYQTTGTGRNLGDSGDFTLLQNYPNPFKNSTTIMYQLYEKSEVMFRIYDVNQRLVSDLSEGIKLPGTYTLKYKTENLNCGVFFYQMITRNSRSTKKMMKTN